MPIFPALLLTGLFLASGDIYRCRDAAGKLSFQDQPCAGGQQTRLAGGASERALRAWLDAQPGGSPPPAATSLRGVPRPTSAIGEAQLAICSERFLHCASDDADAMDRCVAGLARSGGCPNACVARYQALRAEGHALAPAVRLTLLDPSAPACGAPSGR
ncbi:MAG: DUF4124 domain-containing protein [Xanthomonadales bacterium]|nr:hypothetical protein [Xanthomonadales bacterium]MCC6593535.1 DUF4124 domain-containing protein [Xanthomonadales bacterium]MCE7930983.1 DUF4124 domain-containing protein [Xanthomonadales bacterium PRO6]